MFTNSLLKTILRLLVVLLLLGFSAWSFWQYRETKRQLDTLTDALDSAEQAQQARQELIARVGRLMVLPEGEDPLIFDIENAAALAQAQAFFRNAVNGDKVLIYPRAGRSIIYSPSRNIIVNVGTLLVQNLEETATESTEAVAE
ncbi:MAG: hypothetical protein UX28_C0003G0156 [Candidatus Pacebacteria bacterium GW2011_GWA1_46_10]|nr:MAG: hypothetical protein UX28_C0003G0156 [Candidatus Pacebacteria bacterium GW2011_GWA1_46_10]HCR81601.1 hypothetical protein [Candidatus Paceibacterota bacterium]